MNQPSIPVKSYLIRALYDWLSDCGFTPYITIDASIEGVSIPLCSIIDGKATFNITNTAMSKLLINNDGVSFNAAFSGNRIDVYFPIEAVITIFDKETSLYGMIWDVEIIRRPVSQPKREKPNLRLVH